MQLLPSTLSTTPFAEATSKEKAPSKTGKGFISVMSAILNSDTDTTSKLSASKTSTDKKSGMSLKAKIQSNKLSAHNASTTHSAMQKTDKAKKTANDELKSPSGSKLYSFIEEDRTDYTGASVDFSAYEKNKGTITKAQVQLLRKKLKEKGAEDESIDCLNQLLASGTPLTLGSISSTLQGSSRASAELSDDERKTFRSFMSKLGSSNEEIDSLLEASDKGDKKTVWNAIAGKLQEQQGATQVSKKEMNSLLKSLDLSEETTAMVMKNFKGEELLSLDNDQIISLLSPIEAELTNRVAAEAKVKDLIQTAIVKTLEEDKKNNVTAPVEGMRGNKRTDQSEELIQDTSKKKSGFDDFIASINKEDADFEEKEEVPYKDTYEQKDSSNHDKISGTLNANTKRSEANKAKDSASEMFSLIETQPLNNTQIKGEPKDLNVLARQHRQEIFTQVESGFLQGKANGSNELTLELAPAELGRVNLILSMKEGEIRATIRTERHESAAALTEQMAELKVALEEQGLKVAEIEVQVGLKEETPQSNQWSNQNDHNMMRDAQERDKNRQIANLRREETINSNQSLNREQRTISQVGLHIVA